MLVEDRRRQLLDAVRKNGSLSVADAEKQLNVSRMTIHRDLDALSSEGLLRKVRGGAVAVDEEDENEIFARPFEERQVAASSAKRNIAKHVVRLIQGANTLVLDASTTLYMLARSLPHGPTSEGLFIVTGGLPLFRELVRRRDGLRVALHGGEPHPRTGSLVGPLAQASLNEIRFDWAVVSAAGLVESEGVVYDSTPEEAEIKRAYLRQARRRALAIDKSKLNKSAPYKFSELDAFDTVITEEGVFEVRNGQCMRTSK